MNLPELVQRIVNDTLRRLRVAMPAEVVSYDPERSMVKVRIVQPELLQDGTTEQQPVIAEVPVSWMRCGGAWITFPINPGDTGLLTFCDADVGGWVSEGDTTGPDSERRHSISDAVFLPGIQGGGVESNPDDVEIQYQGSTIHIRHDGSVEVNAPVVLVNTEDATLNTTTATVNAEDTVLNTTTATVNAEENVTTNTPLFIVQTSTGGKMVIDGDRIAAGNASEELLALVVEFMAATADAVCITGSKLSTSPLIMSIQARLESIKGSL